MRPDMRRAPAASRRHPQSGIQGPMIRTIAKVVPSRVVDTRRLGWLSGARARTRSNFPANFQYIDLRGTDLALVDRVIVEERDGYDYLEANDFSDAAIDEIDRRQLEESSLSVLDFGVSAAVAMISAIGCVPVTSCRGPTLGRRPHAQPAPMIVFYAQKRHVARLMDAVIEADCHIVNNGVKLELYADDLRKLHRFAVVLRRLSNAGSGENATTISCHT
jgi:hypothetical protein